jgi:LemA protein
MTTRPSIAILAVVVAAAGLAGCNQYDQLIAKDQVCEQKWADYQAQLQRRADLVPNLVATVRGSAQHEEKTLAEVTEARARATSITLNAEDLQDPEKVAAFQKAQDQLKGALSRLLVANEAYPDLKANAAFHDLQVQLEGTENRILRSREQYNDAVRDYNTELGKIRGAVVRRATGGTFKPRVYFQASADAATPPKVTF